MPTFTHGKDAVFKLQGAGGGAMTDLSPYLTSEDLDIQVTLAALPDVEREWVYHAIGMRDGTIALVGLFHSTPHALLSALHGDSTPRDFEYGPQGTAAGAPKITGKCVLGDYDPGSQIDGSSVFSASLQMTGTDTVFGTY